MLSSVEIKPDVYFVGALDWNACEFHGYVTEQGITYNTYFILDERARHWRRQADSAVTTVKGIGLKNINTIAPAHRPQRDSHLRRYVSLSGF